ncbi:phosphomethylpyrimidine kinase [Mycobacterium avium subsp. avium 2285 (R)]|nr:phosphomethylpyrimidine kinase [Mycobacterium avium subsp. avium 2285 (R)]
MLSIAGSDSGGGAGIQADLRTMAMLGVHACVAVTAVTVQNTLGVNSFHEVPADVVAGQIEAVAGDIGIQAAKTGMLASSPIIAEVAATWRRLGLSVPLVVDPVCASMHGDPLLAADALDTLRGQLFPLATLVTPNLDEVRLLVDIDVTDAASQRDAAKALHALGPQWVLVKGGHLRSSQRSCDLLYDGDSCYEFDAHRLNTGNDHGGGDTLASAVACALAHGFTVPDAVAFGKRWVTECLRASYPLGHGHGPVSALFRLSGTDEPRPDRGHRPPARRHPEGVVVLTHGAGGNRDSPLLQQVCDEWAQRGWLAVRYNLPFRRRRPTGPPSGSGAADRAGIVEAITLCRGLADGPLIAGGHSYGGRQTSMVVAAGDAAVDVLTLFSYPVHPPGKPERARTEHLPAITVPTVFTHGTSDPFGTPEELNAAAALVGGRTAVVEIASARHDLRSKTLNVAALAVDAALQLLGRN